MSRPWPYNPQASFPPLPSSPASPASPVLRGALRDLAAEIQRGPRPETVPVPRRHVEMEVERPLSPKCSRCEELAAEHAEVNNNYFKEIEHLRRALSKLLDASAKYMPANVLRSLKEQLQLDVRYMTKPEEGEGGPLPPVAVEAVVDQSELIEKLRKQIAQQEKEIKDQKYTIQDLEDELRKLQEALEALGQPTPTSPSSRRRQLPAYKEVQTDPMQLQVIKQQVVVETPQQVQPAAVVEPVKVKKEKPKAAEAAESSSSDEAPTEMQAKKVKKQKTQQETQQVIKTGVDPDVLRKLQNELDLLKMKLASAEREAAKVPVLQLEIEKLKQQLSERDQKIEELEAEIKRLKAKPAPKEVKQEVKKEVKPPEEKKEKKKEKRYKQDPAPVAKPPSPVAAAVEAEKPTEAVQPEEVEEPPAAPTPSESSESESESEVAKEFEDKCVGNGPGKGLQDEPLILKGKGLLKEEELNKTGRCYERYMVEQPALGLTNSGSFTTDDATMRFKGGRGVAVYAGGSLLGGATWSSKSLPRLTQTWPTPEPYLTQLWEQNPKGHKAPVKRELIKLGAVSKASTMQSVAAETLKEAASATVKIDASA